MNNENASLDIIRLDPNYTDIATKLSLVIYMYMYQLLTLKFCEFDATLFVLTKRKAVDFLERSADWHAEI